MLVWRLSARGWPPLAATWAVMGGAVLVIAGASAALAPQIGPEIGTLRDRVTTGLDDVQRWLRTGPLQISDTQLSDLLDRARQEAQTNSRALTRGLLSGATLAVPLAFLVFLGAFLPIVGAFLSGLIAALVALVSKGLVAALIIVGITILVQQLEGHVLAPLV